MASAPSRRRFIAIVPFIGAGWLAACSPKTETAPAAPVAPPPPAPAPVVQAPVAASPAEPPPASPQAAAPATLPMLDEKGAQAMALGYVADSARADKAKFPNYALGRQCNGCALYQGKAGNSAGPCPLFAGHQVSAQGWCNSWVKKA